MSKDPRFHVHHHLGHAVLAHAHPEDNDGHDHDGYLLVRRIGYPPILSHKGLRLRGETSPLETLGGVV